MAKEFDFPGIVPWGRTLKEYRGFFALNDLKLLSPILDVAAGPSSFTAEALYQGARAVAVDPLYALNDREITDRFEEARPQMMRGLRLAFTRFTWSHYSSPKEVEELRQRALTLFLEDYAARQDEANYVPGSLPNLPFSAESFRLALSSHLLFLYDHVLTLPFHISAILEMARVAHEVRIFPLMNMDGKPSEFLREVRKAVEAKGLFTSLDEVPFEFQKGANHMLRVVGPDA